MNLIFLTVCILEKHIFKRWIKYFSELLNKGGQTDTNQMIPEDHIPVGEPMIEEITTALSNFNYNKASEKTAY